MLSGVRQKSRLKYEIIKMIYIELHKK